MRTLLLLGLAVLLATAPGTAQPQPVTLWVTLGDSDQLVEVDAYTFKEVRRITTDPRPHHPSLIIQAKDAHRSAKREGGALLLG